VQNVASSDAASTQRVVREVAAESDRVLIDEAPAGKKRWPQLLEASDLVLCPYRPESYVAGFSAVLNEVLANGIPAVVPAGTTLETLLQECDGSGTAFERFDPASIVAATSQVLDRFEHFANRAHAAALRWPETRGPARLVDELLSLAANP
jgi:cellulose biosynthesis protein BcsQ